MANGIARCNVFAGEGFEFSCSVSGAGFVEGEGYVAIAALETVFAGWTVDVIAVAATVKEEDGLLALFEDGIQFFFEGRKWSGRLTSRAYHGQNQAAPAPMRP